MAAWLKSSTLGHPIGSIVFSQTITGPTFGKKDIKLYTILIISHKYVFTTIERYHSYQDENNKQSWFFFLTTASNQYPFSQLWHIILILSQTTYSLHITSVCAYHRSNIYHSISSRSYESTGGQTFVSFYTVLVCLFCLDLLLSAIVICFSARLCDDWHQTLLHQFVEHSNHDKLMMLLLSS